MVKAFILLWDTINSHPLSISLDTSELMKTKWENTESYCNCRVLGFFFFLFLFLFYYYYFLPSFLTWGSTTFSDTSTGVITVRKFCSEECSAGHWPRLLSAQSVEGGKDIFWLQHSPSSLTSHLLAHVLLHTQMILQDHLSTVHISTFGLHNHQHKAELQLLTMLAQFLISGGTSTTFHSGLLQRLLEINIQYLPFSISSKLGWVLWLGEVKGLNRNLS